MNRPINGDSRGAAIEKFVQAEKLARKIHMSIRTVYRDVKALNEIGVPVLFEPLKGYCIAKGFFLRLYHSLLKKPMP